MSRPINQAGIDLVKSFEGFHASAYQCPAGVWTIGYGHTRGVKEGDVISPQEADLLLEEDLAHAGRSVQRLITVPLTDNQFAALVGFTFNLGEGNLKDSTLRAKLNAGDHDAVPSEMARWVKATDPKTGKKVTLRGLVRRRAAEGILWLTKDNPDAFESTAAMPQHVESVD